jgi:DNA mismatch repair protein MSH6
LLQKLATVGGAEGFPDLSEALDYFSGAFDCAESSKLGYIKPVPGVVAEYDEAEERVVALEQRLEDHRQEMCDYFGAREIKYVNQGKELNQLEIPLEKTKGKKLPDDFELKSSTKKVGRYWTPTIQKLLPKLEAAREAKEIVVGDISRQMFCKFCEHYQLWMRCVESLAQLDCLCSLTIASRYAEGESCRPETCEGEPFLEIRQGRHPCLESIQKGGSFIANDTVLGAGENPARFVLVSGPNMGGKSTLLRQTCTIVIMAQLGCYVPASSCKYTPIDRIFTRVGANDRIMQGQSTFLVELEETANILRHASPHSLVILDELGRGTSTFDGTAIAWAVIEFLCRTTRCMTLFSTHYHMLMEEFKDDAAIAMYHMACVVDPNSTDVTFLYKFQQGTCSKSHGMNVAKLANLPAALVARAGEMSRSFEVKLEQAHGSRREEDPMPVARRLRDCVADGDLKLLMQYHALLQTNTSATLASS